MKVSVSVLVMPKLKPPPLPLAPVLTIPKPLASESLKSVVLPGPAVTAMVFKLDMPQPPVQSSEV